MRIRTLLVIVLAAALLLSGCAKDEGDAPASAGPDAQNASEPDGNAQAKALAADGSWQGAGGCYKLEVPETSGDIWSFFTDGTDLYYISLNFLDTGFSMSLYKNDEALYTAADIRCATAGSAGAWLIADVTDYSSSSVRSWSLVHIPSDGSASSQIDITSYVGDSHPYSMRAGGDGRLTVRLEYGVIVFDSGGAFIGEAGGDEPPSSLVLGGDGALYVLPMRYEACFSIDMDAGRLQSAFSFPGYMISDGGAGYRFTLIDGMGLYGVDESGGMETIALWAECGLAFNNLTRATPMQDGKFLLSDMNGSYILTPADPSEIRVKTVLTMAAVASRTNLSSAVHEFNLQSEDYVIRVTDYSQSDAIETNDAITKLNTEIVSGKYPDLFDFTLMTEDFYADKGLLSDLYGFIDADPGVSREDFILLDKLETNGKLYYTPSHFYVETAAGLWSRFGDSNGWSLDEYLEIQEDYTGEIMYNVTRESFLQALSYRYAATAVDWETGTCDFDNEEFIKILNTCAALRENPEPEDPQDLDFTPGAIRLSRGSLIISMVAVNHITALADEERQAGEKLSFVGRPTPDGSSGTTASASDLAGICTYGNTEGAWEFIKFLITDYTENSTYGISVNRAELERQIEEAINPRAPEPGVTEPTGATEPVMTREDAGRLYALLDSAVYLGTASSQVVDIIMEEAQAFLSGSKTAEEIAGIIQSRVSILAAE